MNKKEILIGIVALVAWFIWLFVVADEPPSYENMTIQERIYHEQIIFP